MKSRRSETTPRSVAVWAACLVFSVGVGTTGYFLEVRGAGLASELAAGRGLELGLVAVALLAGTALSYAAISNLAQQARSSSRYRRLVHRALEVDYADPLTLREFDSIPDLRELVGMLAAEKTQSRELGDRVETLRGEIDTVVGGMQRSAADLGRMRQEGLSPIGMSLTSLWNGLLERLRTAEARPERALESAAQARAVPGGGVPEGMLRDLEERLQAVEASLVAMRRPVQTAPAPMPPAPAVEPEPAFEVSPAWGAGFAAEAEAEAEAEAPMLEIPRFVGRAAAPASDRIEVSYESAAGDDIEDLPASALFFESESEPAAAAAEPIVDLWAFGARELEE